MPCGVNVRIKENDVKSVFEISFCQWNKLVGKKASGKKTTTSNWAGKLNSVVSFYFYGLILAVSGASDGIGKEFALQLAKKGFNILLIGRNIEKLEQVESEISKSD